MVGSTTGSAATGTSDGVVSIFVASDWSILTCSIAEDVSFAAAAAAAADISEAVVEPPSGFLVLPSSSSSLRSSFCG